MEIYKKIKQQREEITAPVDTLGCACVGEGTDAETKKYHILIALLLSSQTRDEVTHAAVAALNRELGGLTPRSICSAPADLVHDCIKRVGYHNKKLKFLLAVSERFLDAPLPSTLEETLSLPGVGKKMAYLYMQHACGVVLGLGVDTHVHRVSGRIGLSRAKSPEGTRRDLERRLPREEWPELNRVLVGFGQTICLPQRPRCESCSAKSMCPSSTIGRQKE